MQLHPAEIAKEIKNFNFFRSFKYDLLLQLATMCTVRQFKAGELILREGEHNTCLYFIRKGSTEVLVAGEVVAVLHTPGEVLGEMSVVNRSVVTSSMRATSDVETFVIDSTDFELVPAKDKEYFTSLLFQIYSSVLVDRLDRANQRVRLFEIANRELYEATKAVQITAEKEVLLLSSDKKQIQLARTAVGGSGVEVQVASDLETFKSYYEKHSIELLMLDDSQLDTLDWFVKTKSEIPCILMTKKDIHHEIALMKKYPFIKNIITRDLENRPMSIRMMLIALSKVLSQKQFGIEKYLSWGAETKTAIVRSSRERTKIKEDVLHAFKGMGVRETITSRIGLVVEEMMMNAIYDAPTNSRGESLYNHLARTNEVVLDHTQQATLCYASDGSVLGVSISDPFGALRTEVLIDYLQRSYSGGETSQPGKAGAGRGLFQIVETSDLTIFNLKPNARTEVISLFFLDPNLKEVNPSFHIFEVHQ